MEDLLTTAEAARELGISPSRVRRIIRDERLPATKRGRDLFIRHADLEPLRVRRPGAPRQERETMTVYTTPSIPQHWIMRNPAGEMFLVPAIPSGWQRRRPYLGHVRGLTVTAPHMTRLALTTANVPIARE